MVSDEVDVEVSVGVPPLGGPEDSRDVSSSIQGGGIIVVIGGRGIGCRRSVSYEVIYLEAEGYYCGVYCEPPNL